jgi:excisionase family DNA binding protein
MTTNMSNKKRTIPAPDPGRRYLRIDEAAQYLGATEWFIRTLGWRKAISIIPMGKRYLIDRDDLDKYAQSQKTSLA